MILFFLSSLLWFIEKPFRKIRFAYDNKRYNEVNETQTWINNINVSTLLIWVDMEDPVIDLKCKSASCHEQNWCNSLASSSSITSRPKPVPMTRGLVLVIVPNMGI